MGGRNLDDVMSVARSISIKLSHILELFVRYKHASSIGAIAGFVIAVFCTWRFLKAYRSRSKKPPKAKDRSPPLSPGDATAGTSTGASQSITHAKKRGGVALQPPEQLTLEALVRRQLNGGRKMTLQLLGVVLEEREPHQLQGGCHVRMGAVEALREISRTCDLYLLAQVLDDDMQASVLSALESSGILAPGGVSPTHVLFCGTDIGVKSFVRQIEPEWHVDSSEQRLVDLSRFVRHELFVTPDSGNGGMPKNVVTTSTFERYFGASQ